MDESISTLGTSQWPTDSDIEAFLTGPNSAASRDHRARSGDPAWAVALVLLGAALSILVGSFIIASHLPAFR